MGVRIYDIADVVIRGYVIIVARNGKMSYNQPLLKRASPKKYMGYTAADEIYYRLVQTGTDPKEAAKQAQDATGLSLLTGQRMRTRGFGMTSKDYERSK